MQQFVKMLTTYYLTDHNEGCLYGFDLHEMQVVKMVVESLLNEIRAKGEVEVVKKYKF